MNPTLLLTAALAYAVPLEGYRISGTVVNAVTGAAVERVQVAIAPASETTRLSYTSTGANGRFLFENLPAGKWRMLARGRGYLAQSFGQPPSLGAPGIAILTGPGESSEQLVFRLYPPGMITGKVTDSAGDPVESALVQVLGWATIGGRRQIRPARSGWTNDDGVYAIGWLPAGLYFVAVTGRPWYADSLGMRGRAVAFAPHFYPGGTDPRSAAPIPVRSGEEVTADFTMTPAPAVSLTLSELGKSARVRLGSEGIQGNPVWHGASETASTAHAYLLVPGRYTAWVWSGSDVQPAIQTIELGARDTVLQFSPDPSANVDVAVEVRGLTSAAPERLGLVLTSEDDTLRTPRMIPPGGRVKYPPMPAGRYRLVLMGSAARGAFIDQVTAEGARYTKGILELGAGSAARLRVVISGQGGRVEGKVYRAGRPFPGALVVLAPRADTGNPNDYRGFVADNDGSFAYPQLKPGDYVIFAIEDGSQFEYANPAAVAPYLESGRPLQLEPGSVVNLKLDLPAPRYNQSH